MYLFLFFFINVSLTTCNFNLTETYKVKSILEKYKNNLNSRYPRCLKSDKLNGFIEKSLPFFDRTQRYGEFLKYSNVSGCPDSDVKGSYTDEHILKGLLIQEDVPESHWNEYKTVHKKEYPTARHEIAALQKWRENLKRVAEHNRRFISGENSYSLHLNLFGDMSATDYFQKILKLFQTVPLFDPAEDHHKTAYRRSSKKSVPTHVDWRRRGFRPRREEQFQCGACYAFAITHALQAQLYKTWGEKEELSPQQIVDCSYPDGNMGCSGGSLRAALRYAARVGLAAETNYPYTGRKGRCRYILPKARPRRWATLPADDEEAMEKALASIGPLAVAVNAAPFTFQLYRSGIYDDPFCTPWQMNHAMLLVGYTPQYWILLNWWGKNWGEDGYMRIRRSFNRCGVANMATYVEL